MFITVHQHIIQEHDGAVTSPVTIMTSNITPGTVQPMQQSEAPPIYEEIVWTYWNQAIVHEFYDFLINVLILFLSLFLYIV